MPTPCQKALKDQKTVVIHAFYEGESAEGGDNAKKTLNASKSPAPSQS